MKKKFKFEDIAVCKTIRGLKQIPGLVRQKLIAEVIDVANGVFVGMECGAITRKRLLEHSDVPSVMTPIYWSGMPSGTVIWNAVFNCEEGNRWPW